MTEPQDRDGHQPGRETPPVTRRTEIADLPQDIQDLIRDLRGEAAQRRKENEQMAQQMQARRDAELAEQQRWQELAEERQKKLNELTPYQDRAQALESTLSKVLDAQLADLPTEAQQAVKDMPGDAQQKLDWLARNRATLTRTPAPDMHAGPRGDDLPADVKLTAMEELIMQQSNLTREQWIDNKRKREQQEQRGDRGLLDRLRAMNSGE